MRPPSARRDARTAHRAGLTLVELLIASTIMAMLVGVLGGLARAVRQGWTHADGQALAAQHARVALGRIADTIARAEARDDCMGVLALGEMLGSDWYSDTLLVRLPKENPEDDDWPVVIYFTDPLDPARLLELTLPYSGDPLSDFDTPLGRLVLNGVKMALREDAGLLTDLLRTAVPTTPPVPQVRGAVLFSVRLSPDDDQWSEYQGGTLDWDELSWPHGLRGTNTAVRHAAVRIELQLRPGYETANAAAQVVPVPYFGAGRVHFPVSKE